MKALTAILALLPALSGAANAQDDASGAAFGAITYQVYCESCHGSGGMGDGPMAAYADPPPTDLTLLSATNGGVFPAERVTSAIDGREEVVGHLDVAMPPWARLFAHDLRDFPEGPVLDELVARRIAHLVVFLESIQR